MDALAPSCTQARELKSRLAAICAGDPRNRQPRLVNRETLADINPAFESDADIVQMPPEQSAFCNGEKVIERDEEVYRNEAQSICMHSGVRSANVIS